MKIKNVCKTFLWINLLLIATMRSSCGFNADSGCDKKIIAPLDYGVSAAYQCTVTILDGDGKPVSGVDINLTVAALDEYDGHNHSSRKNKPAGTLMKVSQITDDNGQFTITYGNELSGKYQITATASKKINGKTQTFTDSGIITVNWLTN
ncbi:MAG: Ig-like domain-containing protein [Spirochaetia bacterium]|nr:Ig-like domain-containing protein [Spirochaetia bacterium]